MALQKFSVKKVLEAVETNRGLVTYIAKHLGCSRDTVRNYANRYPEIRAALDQQQERLVDSSELRLIEAVEKRAEPWAIAMVLSTLGKNRGYVKRTEQSGPDGEPIRHAHSWDLSEATDEELDAIERLASRSVRKGPAGTSPP